MARTPRGSKQYICCGDHRQIERSGKTRVHRERDPEDEIVSWIEQIEAVAPSHEEVEEWNPPAALREWFPLPIKQRRHEEMVARMEAEARTKAAAATSRATVRFRGRSVTATAMRA